MKDSMMLDMAVFNAQMVLDHHLITEDALMSTVIETKSTELIYCAHNANGALQEPSQTHQEDSVLSNQDHQLLSMVLQLVMNTQSSVWIRPNALDAPMALSHPQIV